MASAVVSDNFETGSGGVPQLGGTGATTCKAWVNFDGTGTVAIRDSYNVSSITDNGTGRYSINFNTTVTSTSYAATANGNYGSIGSPYPKTVCFCQSFSTTGWQVQHLDPYSSYYDTSIISTMAFAN